MKRLYLLRHAKSSWDEPELADRDRPLAPRGVRMAAAMADHLLRVDPGPDLVLVSPARRARETWEGVRESLPAAEARLVESLYTFEAEDLMAVIHGLPESAGAVMLVGHNPALEELAATLVNGPASWDSKGLKQMRKKFPTGALAALDVPSAWSEIAPRTCPLAAFVRPKDL